MRRILAGLILLLAAGLPATAQNVNINCYNVPEGAAVGTWGPCNWPYIFPRQVPGVPTQARQEFWDDFSATPLDTNARWQPPTAAGGGVAASDAGGALTLGTGSTTGGYSVIQTKRPFAGLNPGFQHLQVNANIPQPLPSGSYMAWGFCNLPTIPTIATPCTDGVLYELNSVGSNVSRLRAVTYAGGTATLIQDLGTPPTGGCGPAPGSSTCGSGVQPTDTAAHKYYLYFRGDRTEWDLDNFASIANFYTGAPGPNVNTLPFVAIAINGTGGANATLQINAVTIADTSQRATTECDSTYGFNCRYIDAWGRASVIGAVSDGYRFVGIAPPFTQAIVSQPAQVMSISPNSGATNPYPAGALPVAGIGTGTTGAVVGTLAAMPNMRTYICEFDVSAIGGTAAVSPITVAGLLGGTFTYQLASSAGGVTLNRTFTPCIPASANNTAIVITTTADGTASAVDVNAFGYQGLQ